MQPFFIHLGTIILNANQIAYIKQTSAGIKIVTTLMKENGKPYDFYVAGESGNRVLEALAPLIAIKVDIKPE
ncbi:MAG TPA: hypothetical protein VEU96_12160 [Bryobacteraceae bacterium]|nr:hypothetical protein [Bryobacteraceae bacterium]